MRRIHRCAAALAATALATATLVAQDPLEVTPHAYRLRFENEWVKVVHVRYAPGQVLPPHLHTALASAYVYLTDGGPTRFRHQDLPYGDAIRAATKAGSFRVYRGLKEVHSVEQDDTVGSEFLRVELKTDPVDDSTLKGRFFRDEPPPAGSVAQVQFDNAQVRITRTVASATQPMVLTTSDACPALLVALNTGTLDLDPADPRQMAVGDTVWLAPAHRVTVRGSADAPAEFLRFDFKTRPLAGGATRPAR